MITTHRLPEEAFAALARGDSGPAAVLLLRDVQYSKHLMLLHAVATDAARIHPASPEIAAFRSGYEILVTVQRSDPAALAWLLQLPHIGAWAHDCLASKVRKRPPNYGYLAAAAAAAAVRAGVQFELDVPVLDGRVMLPGLGYFHGIEQDSRVRLRSDGERLTVGTCTGARCAALLPEDDSGESTQQWQGTHLVRATADGQTWTVLLETADQYLNRFALPMSDAMTAKDVSRWQDCILSAWRMLVRHHGWSVGSIAAGVSVIVPLTAGNDTNRESATTPAAFGAIATSLPPDPVHMAETLVHEFEHLKLCGLQDMVPLTKRADECDERVYAPWRPDPRPPGNVLQGVYAHLAVARFWGTQRHVETESGAILRAQVMFERWRSMTEPATTALLRTGCLTSDGIRFVAMLREQGQRMESATVPAEAREIANEVALCHRLTWQLRHTAIDATVVAGVTAAYLRGEPRPGEALPEARVKEDTRKLDSTALSQLLSWRFLEPHRYRKLTNAGLPGLSEGDRFLVSGQASLAVQAYRDEICAAPEPLPHAWVGLAIAIHLLAQPPLLSVFATHLPLVFDVHARLAANGVRSDPLELAAWLA